MKTLNLIHPITHNGTEYGRGLVEVDDITAAKWLLEAPDAATEYATPVAATIQRAPGAPVVVEPPLKPNVNFNDVPASNATHSLSAREVQDLLDKTTELTTLAALLKGEEVNPNFPPEGRKGVKQAIANRASELGAK